MVLTFRMIGFGEKTKVLLILQAPSKSGRVKRPPEGRKRPEAKEWRAATASHHKPPGSERMRAEGGHAPPPPPRGRGRGGGQGQRTRERERGEREWRKRRAHPARRLPAERPLSDRRGGAGDPADRGRHAGRGPPRGGGGSAEENKLKTRRSKPRPLCRGAPALAGCPRTIESGADAGAGGKCRGAEQRGATAPQPRHGNAKRHATRPRPEGRGMRGRSTGDAQLTHDQRESAGCTSPDVCAPAPEQSRAGGWAARATPHTASALGSGAGGAAEEHAPMRCPTAADDEAAAEGAAVWGGSAG